MSCWWVQRCCFIGNSTDHWNQYLQRKHALHIWRRSTSHSIHGCLLPHCIPFATPSNIHQHKWLLYAGHEAFHELARHILVHNVQPQTSCLRARIPHIIPSTKDTFSVEMRPLVSSPRSPPVWDFSATNSRTLKHTACSASACPVYLPWRYLGRYPIWHMGTFNCSSWLLVQVRSCSNADTSMTSSPSRQNPPRGRSYDNAAYPHHIPSSQGRSGGHRRF